MTKNALLIPGNKGQILTGQEGGNPDKYAPLVSAFEQRGFAVHAIHIDWAGAYGDWVKEASVQIDELGVDPDQTSIVGFSWGALTALGVSQKYAPQVLGLASISPHGGAGSLDRIRRDAIRRGYDPLSHTPEQVEGFEAMDIGPMALGNLATTSIVTYGSLENDILKERCREVIGLTPGVIESEIPGVGHAIEEQVYAQSLAGLVASQFQIKHA